MLRGGKEMIALYLFFGVMIALWLILPVWSFIEVRRPGIYTAPEWLPFQKLKTDRRLRK
jgi:hypothetical protein